MLVDVRVFVMNMDESWTKRLGQEFSNPYFRDLESFLSLEDTENRVVYPPKEKVFEAFVLTPYDSVKVVIVGQDPYHGPGQAHGLSFSVPENLEKIPPSLKNIFTEIRSDIGVCHLRSGCLIPWARQGVFLLNATLTVRAKTPKSHHGKGWERFTDAVIDTLAEKDDPIVFMLWGKSAQEKGRRLSERPHPHLVLTAAHPSPYSVSGFFGSGHFSQANAFLDSKGKKPIVW